MPKFVLKNPRKPINMYKSNVQLSVNIIFDMLPPIQVDGSWLPEQVDIKSIYLEADSIRSKNGRGRIDITRAFSPEDIINFEDEIATRQHQLSFEES
jgi:hypothetical protein